MKPIFFHGNPVCPYCKTPSPHGDILHMMEFRGWVTRKGKKHAKYVCQKDCKFMWVDPKPDEDA